MDYTINLTGNIFPLGSKLFTQEDINVIKGNPGKINFMMKCETDSSYFLKANTIEDINFKNIANDERIFVEVKNISNTEYKINAGDRLFQLIRHSLVPFNYKELYYLDEFSRNAPHQRDNIKSGVMFIPHDNPKGDKDRLDKIVNISEYHSGDSGIDLFCPDNVIIPANTTILIDMKFSCYFHISDEKNNDDSDDSEYINTNIYIIPRSSIYKTPLRMVDYMIKIKNTPLIMSNGIGLIDEGYRGNIMGIVDNLSNIEYKIKKDTTMFELYHPIRKFNSIKKVKVPLSETTRGEGGFGSTN